MLNLSKPLQSSIIYSGKIIKLNLSFDKVLEVYKLFNNGTIPDENKTDLALSMLIDGKLELSALQRLELLSIIFSVFISSDRRKDTTTAKIVDFEQDSGYIYSSFMMDYGIDLIAEQGKLHWQKFLSLFQGLSERTKIREVMSIRARSIPEPTKYNQEEIRNLMELKAFYALDVSEDEKEENWRIGLAGLAEALKQRAVN